MKLDVKNAKELIKDTLIDVLDMCFVETDDENTVEATMHVSKYHTQTMGILHGGATIALAESIAGVGSNILCASDEQCFGMQISCSHMSSAKMGETVRAIASIVHKGRTTHVWNVDVISENTGKLISSVRVTNAVVKKVIYINKEKNYGVI